MISAKELDSLVLKYENEDFIKDDPVQFVYRGKTKKDKEIAGFIASSFAFGNRKAFIKTLSQIFEYCDYDIYNYIINGDFSALKGAYYRIYKDSDIIGLFKVLYYIYTKEGGLEEIFRGNFKQDRGIKYDHFLSGIVDLMYRYTPKDVSFGFYHMIPDAKKGSAMKKMNMFLRWMIRKSSVDIGLWNFMEPKDLFIPLDVHVARQSREMGLLKRKSNDYTAAKELTETLRSFCFNDPIKYDFAMFAFGVELKKESRSLINV